MFKLLLWPLLFLSQMAFALTGRDVLSQPERPSAEIISQIPMGEIERLVRRSIYPSDDEKYELTFYVAAAKILLPALADHDVFLLSRDMDELHDALDFYLSKHPQGESLRKHLHKLPVSRAVAERSGPSELDRWLKHNGVNMDAIINGTQKALFVDVGWRGQIFKNIIRKTLENGAREPWRERLVALLQGKKFLLLAPWGGDSTGRFIQDLNSGRFDRSTALSELQDTEFYFTGLFDIDPSLRDQAFSGMSWATRNDWVVALKRAIRHWRGRGLTLSQDGTRLTSFDSDGAVDAEVDRGAVLLRMKWITDLFSQPSVKEPLDEIVKKISTPPALRLIDRQLDALITGQKYMTEGKRVVEVLEVIHSGSDSIVYKVRDTKTSDLATLKVVSGSSEEAFASLARGEQRLRYLTEQGIPCSKLYETHRLYLLKEWVQGKSGKDWLADLQGKQPDPNDPRLLGFFSLLQLLKSKKFFLRNLSASNLIWNNGEWIIIDSGSVSAVTDDVFQKAAESAVEKHWSGIKETICNHLLLLPRAG